MDHQALLLISIDDDLLSRLFPVEFDSVPALPLLSCQGQFWALKEQVLQRLSGTVAQWT